MDPGGPAVNLFAVDPDPRAAARALHDDHVIKMATEAGQILSSSVFPSETVPDPEDPKRRLLRTSGRRVYRITHVHHPVVAWAGASSGNWDWAMAHGLALCAEYRYRYGRDHGAEEVLQALFAEGHRFVARGPRAEFVQSCPEVFRGPDPIAAYRAYYAAEKMLPKGRPARWTRRRPPSWLGVPVVAGQKGNGPIFWVAELPGRGAVDPAETFPDQEDAA